MTAVLWFIAAPILAISIVLWFRFANDLDKDRWFWRVISVCVLVGVAGFAHAWVTEGALPASYLTVH